LLQWIALGRVSAIVRDAGMLLVHVGAAGIVLVRCCNGGCIVMTHVAAVAFACFRCKDGHDF